MATNDDSEDIGYEWVVDDGDVHFFDPDDKENCYLLMEDAPTLDEMQ